MTDGLIKRTSLSTGRKERMRGALFFFLFFIVDDVKFSFSVTLSRDKSKKEQNASDLEILNLLHVPALQSTEQSTC